MAALTQASARVNADTALRSAINASSLSNTIVAAVAGKSIVVLAYKEVCAAAQTITWESSGGTVIVGPCSYAANGGAAPPYNPVGHFATAVGEGLIMVLTNNGVQVGGHLTYALV